MTRPRLPFPRARARTPARTRTAARAAAALACATLAGACASTPDGHADALAGCWYFQQDAIAGSLGLPWGVRLSADPLEEAGSDGAGADGLRVALTLVGPRRTADHPFGYWQPLPGDSVRIGYPGMGGLEVRAAAGEAALRQQALAGTARPVGDAGSGSHPPRPITLTRAACPE